MDIETSTPRASSSLSLDKWLGPQEVHPKATLVEWVTLSGWRRVGVDWLHLAGRQHRIR
jgi:hypothetical protein